jgi:gamma-glutamylcyclotransferase (GGCT)/AIG2-like uncharacterized protein YtfP
LPEEKVSQYLFAYGWLMRAYRQNAAPDVPHIPFPFVATGTLPGHLYRIAAYPGFIYDPNSPLWVHGEVFEINDLAVLRQLDIFENATPVVSVNPEYRRIQLPVTVESKVIQCWVYEYARSVTGLEIIGSGRF